MVTINGEELVTKGQLDTLGQFVIDGVHTDIVDLEKKVDDGFKEVNEKLDEIKALVIALR